MTIRRRTEETEDGRGHHATTVREHPADSHETFAEEQVVTSTPDSWSVARGWIRVVALWIAVALVVVETILGFRFGFLLGGANPGNGFVDFIYDISDPLAEPFQGIFANEAVDSGFFEAASVIAMVVYLVAAMLLMAAVMVMTHAPSTHGESVATSRSRREQAAHER